MSVGIEAMLWGIASAISLPLGAILGILWKPKQKINSAFMAFGAGALLFALTIELFGHVPHHVDKHGLGALFAAIGGAIAGGLLFDGLNHVLNNRGAYLRKLSSAKSYIQRLRLKNQKTLLGELAKIKIFSAMDPQKLAGIVSNLEIQYINKGEKVFSQGEAGDSMYFISKGKVDVIRHDSSGDKEVAQLGAGEVFGEMGVVTDSPRTADVVALTSITVYRIAKDKIDQIISRSEELQKKLKSLVSERVEDLAHVSKDYQESNLQHKAEEYLEESQRRLSMEDVKKETHGHAAASGAAFAIWLGLLIDSVPESLVIGMLNNSATGMSLAFIAGVFLANLPEAMSSSVSMNSGGLSMGKILMLWLSICVVTGAGAYIGATAFPANPTGNLYYVVLGIEGLAAGVMLTMIAETMLPEAFEQGGAIVGLSTLIGFLAALIVKVL